ncbi:MAG TPA: GNAT family protein [Gaiellales bacterium]|jgi:RimJ/RimL family protein N-acetyltransferase|nr:GNAT family protein [Gaiellales bacterium]
MPGRYRDSHPWPLYGLRITTPRLELRVPDDEDLVELFEAARAGIHAPGEMPFGIPWTDGIHESGALEHFLSFHWTARGTVTPEKWQLPFAVVSEGAVIGTQELMSENFAGSRSVSSGSWLTASAQGRGLGVEMRAGVLHLAFAGLGALEAQTSAWEDNLASQRVSLRLGYEQEGQQLLARRDEPTPHLRFRLTREAWQGNHFDGIEIHDLEPCLALLGAA